MNIKIFNIAVLLGWALASAGAIMLNTGAGVAASGLLLIALTVGLARMAGLRGNS